VGVSSFVDPAVVKTNNLIICNSPGCNRHAVSEWIIFMILTIERQLYKYINTNKKVNIPLPYWAVGLAGKNITILGQGSVGKRVGEVCKALEMNVIFFKRGDNLLQSIKNADVVVDALSANPSSKGLLNKKFFNSVKKGSVFISVTVDGIEDFDAMISALDEGLLAYVAHDVMNAPLGDVTNPIYDRLRKHPKVCATPHISSFSDVTTKIGNDMMIDNIEAWSKGKPINVFGR
jgi:phosphoglycerate dehydrogenase-like enzyme